MNFCKKMSNLLLFKKLLKHANKKEKELCWNEALITYKECVNLCRYTINNQLSSERCKEKVRKLTLECIENGENIENLLHHLKNTRAYQAKLNLESSGFNPREKIENYLESKQGEKHTEEQIKCIRNIVKLVDISKPEEKLSDVFGMEGKPKKTKYQYK